MVPTISFLNFCSLIFCFPKFLFTVKKIFLNLHTAFNFLNLQCNYIIPPSCFFPQAPPMDVPCFLSNS